MPEQRSDTYSTVHTALEQIKQKLVELSSHDLSKIHIGHEWSWMPYVKDHLDFLVEQVGGLSENLQDAPPPSTPEEIKVLRNDQITNI
jgi:hypothetical protein